MSDESPGAVRRDRFSGGPARGFLSSLADDARIFHADLAVDRAHVVMLAEQGIVDDDVAGAILRALAEIEEAGHGALSEGEDVHEAIETAVIDSVGAEGGKMHTARSRNDEVATCLRYRLREDLLDAAETTLRLREVLADAAEKHTETVMPGYTHLQPAQPTTVAHYLLSYESAVERDTGRLLDAYARVNESPLGAAAFAGTPFDVDRERTAELLGFDAVLENAMDASSARDFLVEATSALATHAVVLSGLAEDLVIFANKGYVDLSDDYSSTSSIMPQKKNPDTLELVRSVAGAAAGDLSALLTTLKGLPRAYNRDLQNAHPHAFDAVDGVVEASDVAAGAVATATWEEARLREAAGEGFATATGVADLLAMAGLPFRTAHEIVAEAAAAEERAAAAAEKRAAVAERASGDAASATATGTPDLDTLDAVTEEITGDSLFDHVSRDAVERALDPTASVASRDSVGGPAPESVTAALDTVEETLDDDAAAVDARRTALADAAASLDREVSRYV
jgi:argininosuccinate lyase